MSLRRGFKAAANKTAREVRRELGLADEDPLCPFATADLIGVQVLKLSSFQNSLPEEIRLLRVSSPAILLSAMTACFGPGRVIIYNDFLPLTRSYADIMHEISHLLLHHPPHQMCGASGGRHYDPVLEEEANWLGPALLVSEEAALTIAIEGQPVAQAAKRFKVSHDLMRMRLNVTGALKRAARAA